MPTRICKYKPNMDCELGVYPTNLDCGYCIAHNYSNGIITKIKDPPKSQLKTDCYFYEEDQDGPWCNYRRCLDPKCEGCHAYATNKQVDKLIRKLVDNGEYDQLS